MTWSVARSKWADQRRAEGASGASRRTAAALAFGCALFFGVACGPSEVPPLRMWSDDFAFQVSANPVPPPARQDVVFKVVVRDKKSGQAIEGAEGRIYGESQDHIKTWDGLIAGPQPGTYTGKLNFITAGNWSMGLQFQRDSLAPIEKLDWRQEVVAAQDEAPIKEPSR
jgi:hypothetical protein